MTDDRAITDAVLASLDGADGRVGAVSRALIRHLHAFVREVEPTFTEWERAIDFLTRTGQLCDARRQEFILLSDVLGVSMLVDALEHRGVDQATASTVLGPFYVPSVADVPNGTDIAGAMHGERLHVRAQIRSTADRALPGAIVDVWHADADGFYDVQRPDDAEEGRARFRAAADGEIDFWSVLPAPYPIPDDGPVGELLRRQGRHPYRPAHVHFRIQAVGHRTLVTHLFVAGSEYLDSDVVFGVKPGLIATFERAPEGHRTLDYTFELEPIADA